MKQRPPVDEFQRKMDAFNCPSPTSKKKDRLKQQEKDEAEARAAKAAKDAKMEEAAYRKEAARAAAEAAEYERMTSVTKVVRTASAPAAGRAYRAVDPVDDMASRWSGSPSKSTARHGESKSIESVYRVGRLREVFLLFDLDGSGFVESNELLKLGKARRKLGHRGGDWSKESNANFLQRLEQNDDGVIDVDEFTSHFSSALPKGRTDFDAAINKFVEVANEVREPKQDTAQDRDFQRKLDAFSSTQRKSKGSETSHVRRKSSKGMYD